MIYDFTHSLRMSVHNNGINEMRLIRYVKREKWCKVDFDDAKLDISVYNGNMLAIFF